MSLSYLQDDLGGDTVGEQVVQHLSRHEQPLRALLLHQAARHLYDVQLPVRQLCWIGMCVYVCVCMYVGSVYVCIGTVLGTVVGCYGNGSVRIG